MSRKDRLRAEALCLGYTALPTGSGHIRFVHPSGALVTASSTPGDRRSWLNQRADLRRELRRHGVVVEQRALPSRADKQKARPLARPTPTPAAPPPPALAGAFHQTGQRGRPAGTVAGRPAFLELRRGPDGVAWLALRWAAGTGDAP
jgi:hypothetical protein